MSGAKEACGRHAAEYVTTGMTVGLGTGSTVRFTIERLAERMRAGEIEIRGVPTSKDTEQLATKLGIPLVGLDDAERIDLTIDGADEVDPEFRLVKGGGGALLREKIVALRSAREVIVVDSGKMVDRLARRFLLPVEVVPFARSAVATELRALGAEPTLRLAGAGHTYLTDNGNEIFDCAFADGIEDVPAMERSIKLICGVVEVGLFIGLAHVIVIGHPDGEIEVREKPA